MRFVINEEKRTIVAIIDNCTMDLINYFDKRSNGLKIGFEIEHIDKLYLKDHYTGVSKCAPDDEWNEEVGKKIAYNRAMRAYEVDRLNKMRYLFNRYEDKLNEMYNDQCDRCGYYLSVY